MELPPCQPMRTNAWVAIASSLAFIKSHAAFIVPPVANRSSTIKILDFVILSPRICNNQRICNRRKGNVHMNDFYIQ